MLGAQAECRLHVYRGYERGNRVCLLGRSTQNQASKAEFPSSTHGCRAKVAEDVLGVVLSLDARQLARICTKILCQGLPRVRILPDDIRIVHVCPGIERSHKTGE